MLSGKRVAAATFLFLFGGLFGGDRAHGLRDFRSLLDMATKVQTVIQDLGIEDVEDGDTSDWTPLDDSTEVGMPPIGNIDSPSESVLEKVCSDLDSEAQALRLYSYPGITLFLEDIRKSVPDGTPPWVFNVMLSGQVLPLTDGNCHQVHIPLDKGLESMTTTGLCASGRVLCVRRRRWTSSSVAKNINYLNKKAIRLVLSFISSWNTIGNFPGPNITSFFQEIQEEALTKEELYTTIPYVINMILGSSFTRALGDIKREFGIIKTKLASVEAVPPAEMQTASPGHMVPQDWENRLKLMEDEWTKFCEINTKAYNKIQTILGSSEVPNEITTGSGLLPEEEELEEGTVDSWSALCYELTNTLCSTREEISRISRSLSNNQEGGDEGLSMAENRHNTSPPTLTKDGESPLPKGRGKGFVMQFYDELSKSYFTPMTRCIPCGAILISLAVLSGSVTIQTMFICALCVMAKKQTRRSAHNRMELDELSKETRQAKLLKKDGAKASISRATKKPTTRYVMLPTQA